MGARHYRPGSGRFLQPDRYPEAAADLSLSLDPLAANRYALAGGNPVNYIELDGQAAPRQVVYEAERVILA